MADVAEAGERVVAELRALDERNGGRRIAWTDVWDAERRAYFEELEKLPGVHTSIDAAGNRWAVLRGREPGTIVAGSHLDCVPGGGWLDGCLGVLAAGEALRQLATSPRSMPPRYSVALVDWADEEGSRFGHSLLGSSAACGLLDADAARGLTDADGVKLADALSAYGVDIDTASGAMDWLDDARAYVELHIEQGPVLEAADRPAAAVTGCMGVRRYRAVFTGREAHAGAAPMNQRQDPTLAAAAAALAAREAAIELGGNATSGVVRTHPGTPTAIAARCEITFDLRHRDLGRLQMLDDRLKAAVASAARAEGVAVDSELIWSIDPIKFDNGLVERTRRALGRAGEGDVLVSGALHDAAAAARAGVPTSMLFVRSLGGVSHSREEDSADADLVVGIDALIGLVRDLAE